MKKSAFLLPLLLALSSCIKQMDIAPNVNSFRTDTYLYPYAGEVENATAEIVIRTRGKSVETEQLTAEIPPLKYNKSWLFLFTQDDCLHSAYSCTWAAIHNKPLSAKFFYDAAHLQYSDLPPGAKPLGKTLGSTDGTGNEVRFSFTTTLAPDADWMNKEAVVQPGYTQDLYRFYQKHTLIWDDVREMLNYGCGIAFHNVNVATQSENMILKFLPGAQDSILKHLDGRGCKALAEPDGNKAYIYAACKYPPIQVMTAQAGATSIYPFRVDDPLPEVLMQRWFHDSPSYFKDLIEREMQLPPEERKVIHIGIHNTNTNWVNFLLWLNDTYGKDGDDSVWAPSMEEYYEYNYYRTAGAPPVIEKLDEHTLKLTLNLPSGMYFYYPSVTVNLKGLSPGEVESVSANDAVSGLAYAGFDDGLMINIDCRRFLPEHAARFVTRYEQDKSNGSNRADALYFVNMLKASPQKEALLDRLSAPIPKKTKFITPNQPL